MTREEVLQAFDGVEQQPGDTNTHLAIDELILNGFSEANGARKVAEGHPRIGILLTGSRSKVPNKTILAADRAHEADITMVVIGVEKKQLHQNELESIASVPRCQHLILLDNFTEMKSLKYAVKHRIFVSDR